jgi:Gas vesicle synthesis protein GvpL/GvpF
MLRRRLERHVRECADALAAEAADAVHASLQGCTNDAVRRPAQNRELSGYHGEMLLNGAYLVESDRAEGLRDLVAELEAHHRDVGARIELTGPWPPFNFVDATRS